MNPRLFTTNTTNAIDTNDTDELKLTLSNYFKKINQHMLANSKFFGDTHHEKFLKTETLIKNKGFRKLLNQTYSDFLADSLSTRLSSLSFTYLLNSEELQNRHITSRFDSLEAFHEELYRIRNLPTADKALDYQDRIIFTLFTDPTSPYLKFLLTESYIACEMHFIQFVNKQYSINETDEDKVIEKNKAILTLFNNHYLKHLQYLTIAHNQLLPKINVLINDFTPDNNGSNSYIC